MKHFLLSLLFLSASSPLFAQAVNTEVGSYPNATQSQSSTWRFVADQGGSMVGGVCVGCTTVNVVPSQLEALIFPNGYLPSTYMPSLTGDCTTGTTCTSGTNMVSIAQTSGDAYAQTLSIFSNNNATNANSSFNSGASPFSAGYASIASPNLQTTGATYVNINCTDGTTTSGSEYCGIQGYTVLLISP